MPNLVGVDIGCGIETIRLKQREMDLERLDQIIHRSIPAGFNIRKREHRYVENIDFNRLVCKNHVNLKRAD